MLDATRLCLAREGLRIHTLIFRRGRASINNRRIARAFVAKKILPGHLTLRNEADRTNPGSDDVLSTGVEGDPYLAENSLPDEG